MPVRATPKFSFDGKNEQAQRVARRLSAKMVRQVSAETKAAIRAVILRSIRDGIPPYDAARMIRGMVGLTESQMMTAMRYREGLINAGHLPSRVESLFGRYVQGRIRERALTIARTEIQGALNHGALVSWRQAQVAGFLSKQATKEFIVTGDERLCYICAPLEGQIRLVDETFSFGGLMPPVHPRCRCTAAPAAPRLTPAKPTFEKFPLKLAGNGAARWKTAMKNPAIKEEGQKQAAFLRQMGMKGYVIDDALPIEYVLRSMNDVANAFGELRAAGYVLPKEWSFHISAGKGRTLGAWEFQKGVTPGMLASPPYPPQKLHAFANNIYGKALEPAGFKSTQIAGHTYYHELGHAAHLQSAGALTGPLTGADVQTALKVSRYAAESKMEFVAEVFARRVLTPDVPEAADVTALYNRLKGPVVKK